MAILKIKGHEFDVRPVRDSFNRRALKFKNNILENLRKIGLTEDDVDIELQAFAMKHAPASVTFYYDGNFMFYSYVRAGRFVDNMYVVSKVIEFLVGDLLNEVKTKDEFVREFEEDSDVLEHRKEARKLIGVDQDCIDLELINKKYKDLARKLHPDMEGGDVHKFKELNKAHKLLKKELA